MPVEILSDDQVAVYGQFSGPVSLAELERFFFLDDRDPELVGRRRGEDSQLGFGLQLGTLRFLGTFLDDPVPVPEAVVDFVASQLGIAAGSGTEGAGKSDAVGSRTGRLVGDKRCHLSPRDWPDPSRPLSLSTPG